MPPPELITIEEPLKVYPGGIIVLRAKDWLGPPRGSLEWVNDSRAISGTAVRDSQRTSLDMFGLSNRKTAFQSMSDTLSIDPNEIPFEYRPGFTSMGYNILISILIDGDWDPTNQSHARGSWQYDFSTSIAELGYYRDVASNWNSFIPSSSSTPERKPRNRSHYVITHMGYFQHDYGDGPSSHIGFRAFSRSSSTIVWNIDCVIFLPAVYSGTVFSSPAGWRARDFTFPDPSLEDFIIDGADGGDTNGKFTWSPFVFEPHTSVGSEDSGGDYQKKLGYSSAEDFIATPAESEWDTHYNTSFNTVTPTKSYLYSLHGVNYRASEVWTNDTFSRVIGDPGSTTNINAWGETPEGFGWSQNNIAFIGVSASGYPKIYVDGSEGYIRMQNSLMGDNTQVNLALVGLEQTIPGVGGRTWLSEPSPLIHGDNFIVSGQIRAVDNPGTDWNLNPQFAIGAGISVGFVNYAFFSISNFGSADFYGLSFRVRTGEWGVPGGTLTNIPGFIGQNMYAGGSLAGYTYGASVKFKVEIRRYLLRVKIWLAVDSEPSSWTFEVFRWLRDFSTSRQYPYSDDPSFATGENDMFAPIIKMTQAGRPFGGYGTVWDDFKVEYNNDGTPQSMFASVERYDGDGPVKQIEVPAGPWQMAYWGIGDYTGPSSFDDTDIYLDFKAKLWNEIGAPELQRAEAPFYYMRSWRGGPIDLSKVRFRSFQVGDLNG